MHVFHIHMQDGHTFSGYILFKSCWNAYQTLPANHYFSILRSEDGKTTLLEIKCPSSRWKKKLTEKPLLSYLVEDKCSKEISLRKSHTYYTQIQICLYVLQLEECDLYLYCSVDHKTLNIKRDEEFLSEAIPKLRSFYFKYYLGELVALHSKWAKKECLSAWNQAHNNWATSINPDYKEKQESLFFQCMNSCTNTEWKSRVNRSSKIWKRTSMAICIAARHFR